MILPLAQGATGGASCSQEAPRSSSAASAAQMDCCAAHHASADCSCGSSFFSFWETPAAGGPPFSA